MSKPQTTQLTDWLTKQQAASTLGVSTKTIEKFAATGKLQSARRPQTGRPDAAVYHPEDVERLRQERLRELAPHAVERIPEDLSNGSPTSQKGAEILALTLAEGLRLNFSHASEVRLTERLFLTLKEAAELSGLPQSTLRGLVEYGKLEAMKTGRGWRIRRRDLESL